MINIIRKLNRNHISRKNGDVTLYYAFKAKEVELFNNNWQLIVYGLVNSFEKDWVSQY